MRINELLTESQQLDEGPIAQAIGKGVGKVAGGLGAVAGGAMGAWDAAKKGFQSGRATVAGEPDPNAAPTTTQDINAAGPTGTAPAKSVAGAAGAALQKTAQALTGKSGAQTSQAVYAQIKSQVNQLDDKGKKQIIQLLQKSLAQPAKQAAPAAAPAAQAAAPAQQAAAPAQAEPAAQEPAAATAAVDKSGKTDAGLGKQSDGKFIFPGQKFDTNNGQPIGQPAAAAEPAQQTAQAAQAQEPAAQQTAQAAPAQEPAPAADGKMTPQQIAAKKAELKGKRAAGKTAGTTASGFNQYTKDASSQRIVGANPDGSPKIQQIKASKINLGNNLSEALAQKIEIQKRKMFEASLSKGEFRVFK